MSLGRCIVHVLFGRSNQTKSNQITPLRFFSFGCLHKMMLSHLCEHEHSWEWLRAQLIAPINNSDSNLCLESRQKRLIYGLVAVMHCLTSTVVPSVWERREVFPLPTSQLNSKLMFTESRGGEKASCFCRNTFTVLKYRMPTWTRRRLDNKHGCK